MSRLPLEVKEKAISLRRRGYSIKEVAENLHIAKSTSSLWLRDISLNKRAKERLLDRRILGQYKASLTWQKKRAVVRQKLEKKTLEALRGVKIDKRQNKIYCGLLFWCKGAKETKYGLRFINSDPELIQTFLGLLRKAFDIDENKFRICLHLHQYHDDKKQKRYWSEIAKIPEGQFIKIYRKPNTGKRLRKDYPGCASIYYYDVKVARELCAIYKVFAKKLAK